VRADDGTHLDEPELSGVAARSALAVREASHISVG
jgi:hypothetical protein